MSKISDYAENKLLDHILGTASYTSPTNIYLSLYTSDPGDDDSGTEIAGSGYSRQLITFNAAASGSASLATEVTFTASGGTWGTVSHMGIHDASTGGNLLWHGPLTNSKTIEDGDSLTWAVGSLTCTID